MRILVVSLMALLIAGCCPKKTVDATAIKGVMKPVLDRHDAYVKADKSYKDEKTRKRHLRSSALVREILDRATK